MSLPDGTIIPHFYISSKGVLIMATSLQTKILKACDILVTKRLRELRFTFYFDAKVTAVADALCTITAGPDTYTGVRCRNGLVPAVGDIVSVCVKNGDLAQKFIDEIY